MKEYTIKSEQQITGEDTAHLSIQLFEKDNPVIFIAKWYAIINYATKKVELEEYRIENGVTRRKDKLDYTELSFVGWELLDQSIAIPSALKRLIANELSVYC